MPNWCGAALLAFVVAQGVATATWAIDRERSLAQMHHTSWTFREGAPTFVQIMAQTDDGFLWFGTNRGLVRFDGVQFERYVPASGEALPTASIRSLLALPGNGLIIGWFFGGATLLRDGRAIQYGEREGYPPGTTYEFVTDGEGRLWAATSNALARFDGERWHRVGADWNFVAGRAIALFVDRAGTLGAFTDSTLMTLAKGATSFRPTGGSLTTRSPIVQSRDGTYFLLERRGIRSIASLEQYDRVNRPWIVKGIAHDATGMIVDRDGALWFGDPRGVARVAYPDRSDPAVEHFSKRDGLSDDQTSVVFEDREGSVWVTTGAGVDRFRVGTFVPPTGRLVVPFPAMVPTSEGGLLLASRDRTLRKVTPQGVASDVGPIYLDCAYVDLDGVTWFGTHALAGGKSGLVRHAGSRFEHVALPADAAPRNDVQAIAMDASRSLWISVVGRGIYRRMGNEWVRPAELPDAGKLPAIVMTADASGGLWLGYTHDRVARWKDGTVRVFSAADGLDLGNVLAIRQKGSHVWAAGQRGLALFESDRFRPLAIAEPGVMRGLTGIVETEGGDLWIHGNAGAIHVKSTEVRRAIDQPGHRMSFQLLDHEDGLFGAQREVRPLPTLVEGADGRLWFGTNRGAFALDPRRIPTNITPPTVIVKAVIAGNASHTSPVRVDFPALTTAVQIDYTATNLATPLRTRFRYKLTGLDREWQDAGARRQAFYTNLGPGSYRFQVIAANEDGVWNTTGAAFDFAIAPAWYQTRWFAAFCVLATLALVGLVFNLRIRQMRARIQARLEERHMERERIARELHDTLLQGFQGLVLTIGATIRRIAPGEPRDTLKKALDHAQETLSDGRDRVRDLRNSVGFDGDLSAALKNAAANFAIANPATFMLAELGTRRDLHPVDAEEVFLIAREALANAYRHADAQRIEAEIEYGASQVRVRIRDDGKGVPAEVIERGVAGHWGMTGMRERAEKVGARLSVRSDIGSGTEVELEIKA